MDLVLVDDPVHLGLHQWVSVGGYERAPPYYICKKCGETDFDFYHPGQEPSLQGCLGEPVTEQHRKNIEKEIPWHEKYQKARREYFDGGMKGRFVSPFSKKRSLLLSVLTHFGVK